MTYPGRRRLRVRQLSILFGRISATCGKATTVYHPGLGDVPMVHQPVRVRVPTGNSSAQSPCSDVCTGMFTAWGISTALFNRERTGKGRYLDIAMLDSIYSMMLTVLSMQLYTESIRGRSGLRC